MKAKKLYLFFVIVIYLFIYLFIPLCGSLNIKKQTWDCMSYWQYGWLDGWMGLVWW